MPTRSTPRSNKQESVSPSPSTGTSWMWLGGVFGLVGITLALEKFLPAPVASVVTSAHEMGVNGDVLAMGGFLLIAVGALAKSAARNANRPNDDALLLEQVASDLLVVKDTLELGRQSTQMVHDDLRAVHGSVHALTEARNAPPQGGINGEDAIFRLAASLDQLGARIEQRMKSQYGEMQSSLDELGEVVTSLRGHVDEMVQGLPAEGHPQPGAPAPSVAVEAPRAPLPMPTVDAVNQPVPLGLLDQLDDALAPVAQHLVASAMTQSASVQGAQATSVPHHDDTDDKLAELRALLTDERLRAALEQMRRTA
jgi:hypothetical protein